jgi:hypothetical protein
MPGEKSKHYDVTQPYTYDAGALIVPTAEFVSPYAGLTEEEKAILMEQVEAPPQPEVAEADPSTLNS